MRVESPPNCFSPTDERSLIYPGLFGCAAAACLLTTALLSRIEGPVVTPAEYAFLSALCWSSLAASAVGAVWALALRASSARKTICTLIISLCCGIMVASAWARVALLPKYVGVPMKLCREVQKNDERAGASSAMKPRPIVVNFSSPFALKRSMV